MRIPPAANGPDSERQGVERADQSRRGRLAAIEPRPTPRPATENDRGNGARLLDLHGAAVYLGVSYWTVRELIFAGAIPSVKLPSPRASDGRAIRRVLVDRQDLDRFIESNKESEEQ